MNMKKMFRLSYAILFLASLLTACTVSDPQPNSGKYGKGVLVINEGNFSQKNGSLSFVKDNDEVITDVFFDENGVSLGGIIQSVKGYNLSNFGATADKLAIVTNNTDQIIFTDADTLKLVGVMDANGAAKQLDNPQAFAALNGKGYVTNWGDINLAFGNNPAGFITEINLQTRTFVRKIPTPNIRPQGIVAVNNKLYVTNNNSNTVSVYNSSGDLTQTIIVASTPDRIIVDAENKIWVICNSHPDYVNGAHKGTLVKINPATDLTETSISDVPCASFGSKIALYDGKIYSVAKSKVYTVTLATQTISELISNDYSIYGFGVNPQNGDLYLGEGSFSQASRVRRLSNSGNLIKEYLGGLGVNGFLFYR